MQHDQEFSRLSQEHIERDMLNALAEGTIKDIFMGKTKSYIRCMNVDCESSRSEEFYDIQLNVKGCRNLKESFEEYIREEILEKENKYMAEGQGLQDAKKGVIFEAFPPVLQIQRKRFDYDMNKNAMVKVNDRYEFPAEIDLQPYHISKKKSNLGRSKFLLLDMYCTGLQIRTTQQHTAAMANKNHIKFRFEFNDERVTPATLDEVFEANFGGQSAHESTSKVKRETNAYMLVYIRDSSQDQVLAPVTIDDIPHHLLERIAKEKKMAEAIKKQRVSQHLYMTVYVVTDDGFLMNRGVGFTDPLAQNEDVQYQDTRLLRNMSVGDFLQQYTAASNRNMNDTRVYIIACQFQTAKGVFRPVHLVPREYYDSYQALQELCSKEDSSCTRLYIEHWPIQEAPTDPNDILLFAKYYDPVTQTLRGVGKLHVSEGTLLHTIEKNLSGMVGLERGVQLDMYQLQYWKENDMYELNELAHSSSCRDSNFINGSIICFQRHLTHWGAQDLFRAGKCPDEISYYQMLLAEVNVYFMRSGSVYHQAYDIPFKLALNINMPISEATIAVARHLQQDSDHIQLLYSTDYANPLLKGICRGWELRDALQMCPNYNSYENEKDVLYLKKIKWTLYYDVLPMSLADARGKKMYRINVCNTFNQPQTKVLLLSKNALVSEMCHLISPRKKVREFKVKDGLIAEVVGKLCTVSHWLRSDADNVYAEITPKEECNISQEEFYITVYHYEKTLTQTHSIPFKFLIIKDEPFNQTKRRLQERTGLNGEQWSQVKFTTAVSSHIKHQKKTYDPTIEDSYRKQVVIDDYPCVLEVLDTAGQEEYTALRDQWIRDGEGFLIVYSITSRSTYDRVNKFRDQIFRVKDLTKVPLILVGNKCDKVTDREVTREEGAIKARTLNCDFVETSAKTCVNVERSFYSVVRLIRHAREGFQDGSQKNKKNKKDKKCNIL
ncbi:AMP-binding domain-containing protein [Mucor velutinosus]|uniref:AMP-binding domain-containing protein n=1 Tax=Mucor velutinosus TaxID=708070 RepID=A0AAN7D2E1_9FUNG|nr:AMP-binding domain-containing protein [Mucor velutinosus]